MMTPRDIIRAIPGQSVIEIYWFQVWHLGFGHLCVSESKVEAEM